MAAEGERFSKREEISFGDGMRAFFISLCIAMIVGMVFEWNFFEPIGSTGGRTGWVVDDFYVLGIAFFLTPIIWYIRAR